MRVRTASVMRHTKPRSTPCIRACTPSPPSIRTVTPDVPRGQAVQPAAPARGDALSRWSRWRCNGYRRVRSTRPGRRSMGTCAGARHPSWRQARETTPRPADPTPARQPDRWPHENRGAPPQHTRWRRRAQPRTAVPSTLGAKPTLHEELPLATSAPTLDDGRSRCSTTHRPSSQLRYLLDGGQIRDALRKEIPVLLG